MAGFFDDLGKRLSETANDLGKKAEDTLEIQKRKSDIRFLSRANDRDYMDIGKIIFEKYRNGEVVDTDMAALCEAIDQRNEEVTKIQAEIEHRKLVERKELIEAVKEARSHGDLSENFEYHAAKKAKNQNESRIRYLERMLKTAEIVEDHSKEDEIGLNNTVELYCEDDDEVETYRIVTSVRGSSLNGLVSIESPIGKALLGHKEGERVYIKVNDDFGYYVVIRKVIKTESEEDDQIRKF